MRVKGVIFSGVFLAGIGIMVFWENFFSPIPIPSFTKSPLPSPLTPLSIGVVDINRIKNESRVFQNFKEKFDGRNTIIHKEIMERETRLRDEYESIRKQEEQAKEPSPDVLKQKTDLDKKLADLEATVQLRRDELYTDYSKALIHIKDSLKLIMHNLGKLYGLKIILNRSLGDGTQMDQSIVLYCKDGLDLTDQVIEMLDVQNVQMVKKKISR